MPTIQGSLATSGEALVNISVAGPSRARRAKQFPAVIDTGFTGAIQMPLEAAEALGIQPFGTTEQEYSDGRVSAVPLALGRVKLGAKTKYMLIHIHEEGHDVLVGLEFLREFRKALVVAIHENRVLLVDSIASIKP